MAATIPLYQFQVASVIGLLGIYIGWRGGMIRLRGFYDGPNATKHLMFGLVIGVVSGYMLDILMVQPMVIRGGFLFEEGLFIAFVIGLAQSLLILLLLTRKGVLALRSSPTSGWALGLGIGAMQSVSLGVRILDSGFPSSVSGFGAPGILLCAGFAAVLPWLQAIISSGQGAGIVDQRRWKPLFVATGCRAMLFVVIVFGMTYPPLILVLIPLVVLGQGRADRDWLPAALLPTALQEYRRVRSLHARSNRNNIILSEEE